MTVDLGLNVVCGTEAETSNNQPTLLPNPPPSCDLLPVGMTFCSSNDGDVRMKTFQNVGISGA